MFTQPKIPTPRVAVPPSAPISTRELMRQSELDMQRLLRSLKESAPKSHPTPKEPAKPTDTQIDPAPAHEPSSPDVATLQEAISENRMAITIGLLGVLALIAAVFFISLQADGKADRVTQNHADLTAKVQSLSQKQTSFETTTNAALHQIRQSLAEVKNPPSGYQDADNAFREGRYLEAENGFRAFVIQNPKSHVADKALTKAAQAAGMRGQCGMVDSYQAMLQRRQPDAGKDFDNKDLRIALQKVKEVARACRQLKRR
jgi:TolA-binding protein